MKKLVRDKIIDIIKAEGKNPKYKVLSTKKYIYELKRKLQEESLEVLQSTSPESLLEELADVQEVIDCLLKVHKFSKPDLNKTQLKKKHKRGSFTKKLFLIKV